MTHHRSGTRAASPPLDWPAVLDRHRVAYLVLSAELDGDLLELFQSTPTWTTEYEDGGAVLLRRRQESHSRPDL